MLTGSYKVLINNIVSINAEMTNNSTLISKLINYGSDHPLWLNIRIKKHVLERVCFALINRLQTSMEPEISLSIFRQEIGKYLPISDVTFCDEVKRCDHSVSTHQGYCISQRLTVESHAIGCLKCYFVKKPTLAQVKLLKHLAKILSYPLSNAIQFQQIKSMALTDNLTGLANRNEFEVKYKMLVASCLERQSSFSLLIIDLDGFKCVNDQFGHQTGDLVLSEFARLLLVSCREEDEVFRFGGDEFIILLNDANLVAVPNIAKRIKSLMTSCPFLNRFGLSCSIGSALYQKYDDPKQLFGRADDALYRAKKKGKNCLEISPCSKKT
jgi:two-component system cell cycle response regulator